MVCARFDLPRRHASAFGKCVADWWQPWTASWRHPWRHGCHAHGAGDYARVGRYFWRHQSINAARRTCGYYIRTRIVRPGQTDYAAAYGNSTAAATAGCAKIKCWLKRSDQAGMWRWWTLEIEEEWGGEESSAIHRYCVTSESVLNITSANRRRA